MFVAIRKQTDTHPATSFGRRQTLSIPNYAALSIEYIHRVKWRHCKLWSRYDLHVEGHDVVLYEVNWWRFLESV